jgi:hypothetical protein
MIKRFEEFINEGLIKSATTDQVIKNLTTDIGLSTESVWVEDGLSKGTSKIKIEFDSKNADKLPKVHQRLTNVFGWFLSSVATDDLSQPFLEREEIDHIISNPKESAELIKSNFKDYGYELGLVFIYEPKFDKKSEKIDTLYHITDFDNIEKIEKQGLIPKSKSKKSIHPERIYLGTNKEDLLDGPLSEWVNKPVLYEIDNRELNLKLHKDVNMENAVYTTDNIPPSKLKRISR